MYGAMAAAEQEHWWFRARRRIVEAQIDRLGLPASARILEAGCGSGGNLAMLARHGDVSAFEFDAGALALARQRGVGRVVAGQLPDGVPFEGEQFDLLVLLDVVEHLADDRAGLASLLHRLKPGAPVLITVPALKWLWGPHDVAHQHHRRYTHAGLRQLLEGVRLHVEHISYFNTLLFPVAALRRVWQRAEPNAAEEDLAVPSPPMNRALEAIFASERHLLQRLRLPIGMSLIAVARAV
jgi:SAM-dependent methyltransferase